jgi:hypothetical protein
MISIVQNYDMDHAKYRSMLTKTGHAALGLLGFAFVPALAEATPQFARTYRVDCSYCHSSPPRLNERGLRFIAAGYRIEGRDDRSRTIPLAVWNTIDLEWRHSAHLVKGFPSRVELISAGPIGRSRASYFAELRALSQSIGGDGRLLNRSGRFEDLFLRAPVTSSGALAVTAGQFRTLTQVDVSLRLSLSEPLVFSSNVPGRRAADTTSHKPAGVLRVRTAAGRACRVPRDAGSVSRRRLVRFRHTSAHGGAHDPVYRRRQLRVREPAEGDLPGSLSAIRPAVGGGSRIRR